ncbi:MAG: hypothetical protein ACRD2C_25645 [Acidimicrobiales bacterium]
MAAGSRSAVSHSGSRNSVLSALLIQLWHLQWYISAEFRDAHLATRDLLLTRLLER